jgi:hypothetical protein
MKKIIPLLWIILLLSSCYSNPEDLEKITKLENKILVLENQLTILNIDNNIKCLDLWEKSKERVYWEEIANYQVNYNTELETCIVWNIYSQSSNVWFWDKYFISVYDLIKSDSILFYVTYWDENEYNWMTWSEAIEKYKSYWLNNL